MLDVTLTKAIGRLALEPLSCTMEVGQLPAGGTTFDDAQTTRLTEYLQEGIVQAASNFWPSTTILQAIVKEGSGVSLVSDGQEVLRYSKGDSDSPTQWLLDDLSLLVTYPWHLLSVNSELVQSASKFEIKGTVRPGATIDGNLSLGAGSTILPGVYVEGNVVVGQNCMIGPNCYLRGDTAIYDNCHVGHAVEIKNSILMPGVSAGHLTYLGDSIIGSNTNLGAGTITANFRHDGKTHRSMVNDELIDTGRRKFGTVIGEDVHTGINTSIYPGRKIWPKRTTLPGQVVDRDVC